MAKYSINDEIRGFIEYQVIWWEENKKILAAAKQDMIPSQISQYGPHAGGSHDSEQRPTEDIALRIASDEYIAHLERSVRAIGEVLDKLSDIDKQLIRLKYWSGELTAEGIALKLNMDKATMYRHLNVILIEIAKRLGYVNL